MNALPTAEQLERLPVRAVVAFAARTARRLSTELRGIVSQDTLDEALRLVDTVAVTDSVAKLDRTSLIRASESLAAAYAAAPAEVKSPQKFLMVFSLVQATLAAMYAIEAAANPGDARAQMKDAAQAAERSTRNIETLHGETANVVSEAARRDFEILRDKYGDSDEVVIGEPVQCFDNGR